MYDVNGGGLISAASPITFAANASTSGGMTYNATDTAAAGDNITINTGVTVQDTTASLVFNAGDNFVMNGTAAVTANFGESSSVTINVDVANLDAVPGGTVTIPKTATISTSVTGTNSAGLYQSGGGTFINGNAGNDTFNIAPQAGSQIFIDGKAPTTPTGDTLNIDLSAMTTPHLDIVPTTAGGIGNFSFAAGSSGVHFQSIETFNTVAGGPYDLGHSSAVDESTAAPD